MYFLVLLSIVSCGLAQQQSCPDIKQPSNFNFTAFAQGTWYEVARYNVDFESTDDCSLLSFFKTDKGLMFNGDAKINKKPVHFTGSVDSHDGYMFYYSDAFRSTGGVIPVKVLDFDVNSHYITYSCSYDEKTKTKQDMAWIFSRTKTVDKSTQNAVQEVFDTNNILDKSKFYWDQFTNEACKD